MRVQTSEANALCAALRADAGRDRGATLVEIIIAVVLMGLTVVATMSLLTTTVGASRLDRDHSNAHAWLQTASDMLYAREPKHCEAPTPLFTPPPLLTQRAAIMADYESTVQKTNNPEDWPDGNITVIDLQFWHYARSSTNGVEEGWVSGALPTDRCTTKLQLVKLQVKDQSNQIIEEVEVVIGGE